VVKQEDGRRNRYQIEAHLPLPETTSQQPAIGEVLALLAGTIRVASPSLWPCPPGAPRTPRGTGEGLLACRAGER